MRRRAAIRNLVIISAGAAVLPSCMESVKPGPVYKNLTITASQFGLLESLVEVIIPSTPNFPGARALKSHEFVLTMMNDCAKPEDRQTFVSGLKLFEDYCKTTWNKDFAEATNEQRSELIKSLEAAKDAEDDRTRFYRTVKRYTIQSFTTSRDFLVNVRKFTLVPGSNYKGCVKIGAALNT